SYSGYS
nr:Chain A, RNA-binding protein FUS [Homo sapiens]6BWZ_A Chain A, SYSGYS peptide from low-complexity domain of FUS [Homo sapiens]6KJ1_A Chain A, RNA-binding protein FUS [Homo sapiens]6KJ2_A Chain A, RNA-binding protein FUS [Homo sapiens]6KJ3_A Chain A, RNA-binding protein FUS [Homo sapiens]6KJ4_A Chain A, RNA-binding protein FUS [Homo sapiens]